MPVFELVRPEEAPAPEAKTNERMELYNRFVMDTMERNEVGQLVPEGNETYRGIVKSLRNAGARMDVELDVWGVGNEVYFKVLKPATPIRNRRN